MVDAATRRFKTLVQRELREYRNSLVRTPVLIALVLALVMLASVLMANSISAMGDAIFDVIMQEDSISGMNITIKIEDDKDAPTRYEYHIEQQQEPVVEDDWDFAREWNFSPGEPRVAQAAPPSEEPLHSLNPLLTMLHNLVMLVMVLVSANYLLGCLFADRKDRSILFWKSLPVSEWEEVLSKLFVALMVVPAIYIVLSMLTQLVCTGLAMLLVWRMDRDPVELVLGNVEFGRLFLEQLGEWLKMGLLVVPVYGWLLVASAAARRSPFMFAIAPLAAVYLLERIFLGSAYLGTAISRHIPHYLSGDSTVGMQSYVPGWAVLDWFSVLFGLLFTAGALWVAVYLRRYRFES